MSNPSIQLLLAGMQQAAAQHAAQHAAHQAAQQAAQAAQQAAQQQQQAAVRKKINKNTYTCVYVCLCVGIHCVSVCIRHAAAQKVFAAPPVAPVSGSATGNRLSQSQWDAKADSILRYAVDVCGPADWMRVATTLPGFRCVNCCVDNRLISSDDMRAYSRYANLQQARIVKSRGMILLQWRQPDRCILKYSDTNSVFVCIYRMRTHRRGPRVCYITCILIFIARISSDDMSLWSTAQFTHLNPGKVVATRIQSAGPHTLASHCD